MRVAQYRGWWWKEGKEYFEGVFDDHALKGNEFKVRACDVVIKCIMVKFSTLGLSDNKSSIVYWTLPSLNVGRLLDSKQKQISATFAVIRNSDLRRKLQAGG